MEKLYIFFFDMLLHFWHICWTKAAKKALSGNFVRVTLRQSHTCVLQLRLRYAQKIWNVLWIDKSKMSDSKICIFLKFSLTLKIKNAECCIKIWSIWWCKIFLISNIKLQFEEMSYIQIDYKTSHSNCVLPAKCIEYKWFQMAKQDRCRKNLYYDSAKSI